MDIGRQKYLTPGMFKKRDHCAFGRLQRPRIMYVLSKQRRKRRRALTIFGRLIGQQLASTSIFNMAESIVKRIKTYLMDGWARRYLPTSANFLTAKSMTENGYNKGKSNGSMDSSEKQHIHRDCAEDDPANIIDSLTSSSTNINAKSFQAVTSFNLPGRKCYNGRTRRLVARSIARPRLKLYEKPMDEKYRLPDGISQQCKRFIFLRNKCSRFERKDKVDSPNKMVSPLKLAETVDAISNQMQTCKIFTVNHSEPTYNVECSMTANVQNYDQYKIAQCNENKSYVVKEKPVGKKRRRRRKTEALLNMCIVQPQRDARIESKDSKQTFPRNKTTPIRKTCEGTRAVITPQIKTRPLNLTFKSTSADSNDWPSLTESERPKGLIKEAATEMVRTKQAGSVARNARKLLAGIAIVKTNDSVCRTSPSCVLANQSGTSPTAAKQRTWASVAAQSLTSPTKATFRHNEVPTTYLQLPKKCFENTLVCKLPPSEPQETMKRHVWSNLDGSNKLCSGANCRSKEKPNSRKYTEEIEDRTKFIKNVRHRKNRMKERPDQKDQAVAQSASHRNSRLKRAEIYEAKIEKIKTRSDTLKLKGNQHQAWETANIPVVCLQSIDRAIATPQAAESRSRNADVSAIIISSSTTNTLPDTKENVAKNAKYNAPHSSIRLCSRSEKLQREAVDLSDPPSRDKRGSAFIKLGHLPLRNLNQHTSPILEDSTKKKISTRYRALLRGDRGRLGAKTVTEIQTRNKKTDSLRQDKITILAKQSQQRLERQKIHHNSRHSPEKYCADKNPALPTESICPYWLRSRPFKSEFVQVTPPSVVQINKQACVNIEYLDINNTVTTLPTNSTSCRRSERIHEKDMLKIACPAESSQ